jgi:hypothetical protein
MQTFVVFAALVSAALAVAPSCKVEGNSFVFPNGTFPFVLKEWGGIRNATACQQLCLPLDGCYAIAYNAGIEQCHGYTDVVGKIGWHPTESGYFFSDNCCTL